MRSHLDERSMTLHRSDCSSVPMRELKRGTRADHDVWVTLPPRPRKEENPCTKAIPAQRWYLTLLSRWWEQPSPLERLDAYALERLHSTLPCETATISANFCSTCYCDTTDGRPIVVCWMQARWQQVVHDLHALPHWQTWGVIGEW